MPNGDDHDVSDGGAGETGFQGRRTLTREELYALVWQTPLSRLAATFNLSDVGLRKICVKHNIPTPPLGYWAKRAHGKPVRQPPLPPTPENGTNHVHLVRRAGPPASPAVEAAQEAALVRESTRPSIIVPSDRPARLHPVAAATAKAVRAAKTDHEGFKHGKAPGGVDIAVGPKSVDRALRIIHAFARVAEDRGHTIAAHPDGAHIIVDGLQFAWRLYEIKHRAPHQPTREELKAQARREEDRIRWPGLYGSQNDAKVYRSWDYFPSGRLAMTITDPTVLRWDQKDRIGHWHDRKSKRLEDYLDDAMAALVTGAIAVKHRLAQEAERARQRAEALERQRREQARRERAVKRHEFVLRKADDFDRYRKLAAFAEYLTREAYQYTDGPVDRVIDELNAQLEVMGQGFEREALEEEIVRLQLYTDDDPVPEPPDD